MPAVFSSVPGSDPAPGEEHAKSTNDRIEWCHHFMKRRHLDLEPIDQSGSDQRDYPGSGERGKSPVEERSSCSWLRPLGYCHALMYRAVELLSEKNKSPENSSLRRFRMKLVAVPYVSDVAPAIPAIRCEIASITAKIVSVAPQLTLIAIPDVMLNFSLVTSQLAAVALDLSRILSKLATVNAISIVVSAPPDDRLSRGGALCRGIGARDH